ncbi:DUF6545 domain-containing protein [Cryobacterium luteum]|uniref:DUF6545 domain-containing protein n=1 Tax=Cryobacterium luteum TaxID=1424661 RepID=A0A1H8JEA4_9MICO|nr:DUF6545 domain-containing protein [Cryobacterium luteum]TFB92326.1 hypothetical protein E3O10_04600 [Cryobacterium luteum]SEN78735.1 hypothetical protein SAMN05216281_11447 [Cryobacterium luteum]
MSLQPKPVYDAMDALLGGVNATYFIFHALAIATVGLADVMVQQAVTASEIARRRKIITAVVAGLIVFVQALLFFGSDWHLTNNISQSFIAEWSYTAYAATTWVTIAFFSISVLSASVADLRAQTRSATRVALIILSLGCLCILAYTINSLIGATQTTLDPTFVLPDWRESVQKFVLLLAPLSMGVGLGLTAAVDALAAAKKNFRDRVLLWQITPLWQRLLADNPELSIERKLSPRQLLTVRNPGVHLYRRHVEIRDSLLLRSGQTVTADELVIIDRAEARTQARTTTLAGVAK